MFRTKRRRRKKKVTFIQRFFRSVVAVVILSAFILGISLMVKEMAGLDPYGLVKLAGPVLDPLLEKVGISTEEAGQVAGSFAERIFKTNIAPSKSYKEDLDEISGGNDASTSRVVVFKAAMMGDSANDSDSLAKALDLAESIGANRVFYLGDYTEFGVKDNLIEAKAVMEASNIQYYSLPGDRDLDINATPANYDNYYSVFDPTISATIGDIKFVLLNNSANYTLIDSEILGQFYDELEDADYVVMSQPLYHPEPSRAKSIMGVTSGTVTDGVKRQADEILERIRNSNAKAIIAGDQHSFDVIPDIEKESLDHIYIGSVTTGELGKKGITLITIYDDDSYSVKEHRLD